MRLAISPEDAARVSADQMLELARYVEQSNPETFQQIASLLAENPVGMAGLGGSVLLIALRAWRIRRAGLDA
jgi:DNA-binding MurR/RpiR family transcriptional regulator